MLTIESTEQLTGARISGDYWDLDALLNAIYEVIGDENRYYDYQGPRHRILGVCLELRNATKGNHNIEFIANGLHKGVMKKHDFITHDQNIYFSVEILWPELIFTVTALNDFIKLHRELIDNNPWNADIAIINQFQALVVDCLKEQLNEEHLMVFMQLMLSKSPKYFRYATQYVDVLNLEYINLSRDERKENLAAFAIRLMIEDEEYATLKKQILEVAGVTKNNIHELPISMKYPETIEW